MLTIREVRSDADYQAWRWVRMVVHPNERCPSTADLQEMATPERLLVLAESEGQVFGSGLADRSEEAERAFLAPRVLPEWRRRGVGTELLEALVDHAVDHGYSRAGSGVGDEGSLAFAERFGFVETDRQIEQVRMIGVEAQPTPPQGYEIVAVADRPELWQAAYSQVAVATFPDMDVPSLLQVSLEDWECEWINEPAAMFVAVADGKVVGVAGLMLDSDLPHRAEVAYTGVRREWRGRSVASTLKRTSMAWAAAHGITEIYTWTQAGNANMRRLNEHLGFTYGAVSISVRGAVPVGQLADEGSNPAPAEEPAC
ncbi:GNAT family N-acetyltransferase [Kribbella albertanoniae]|nr:GNAT family N-acetyltransferase [Kribbella albertanoniae]